MPHLPLMLERGKDVRPPKELALLVGGIRSHPFEQVFESNH